MRVALSAVLTLIALAIILSIVIGHGGAAVATTPGDGDTATTTEDLPRPPIGGDVESVDTEGFYAVYRCTFDSMKTDDAGLISDVEIATVVFTDNDGVRIDELYSRYSWADGRMMHQIVGFGGEAMPVEVPDGHGQTGRDRSDLGPWLPLDGSSYVLLQGWSADTNNSPYAVDLETYSDLILEPAPATTLEKHGWEWNVVPYVGGYTYERDEVNDDGGPTRTTKERIGFSHTAWYHEGTGLLLATESTKERFLFETNYQRHHSSERLVVHPLGVMSSEECILVDTNLNLGSGQMPGVPAAGLLSDGGTPGNEPVTDTDGADTGGEDASGDEEKVDPAAQAAAAGATVLLAGGWLIAETVSGRRRKDETGAATEPLDPVGPVPPDMTLTDEDRYWEDRNRREGDAALRVHQRFADDQWGKFTDRCRDRAAADRAAAAAERHDRQLRRTAADRLEDMATDKGYRDFVDFLDRQLEASTLPSWHQLETMRNGIVKRVGDQAAIDRYNEKSDAQVFVEGYMDTLAREVGKAVGTAHGSILGKGAEWAVRNPLVPLRIGVAVATAGKSELVMIPFDAWDAMEAAADQKMAEQNRELTYWEATKQVLKTGAWHVGGELAGDVISKISELRGGGAAASREAGEEAAEAAARRASRRAGAGTGDDFVRRVEARLDAKRLAREAGEEIPDASARRAAEAVERRGDLARIPGDDYVRNWAREGEVIPRNHLHETGLTDREVQGLSDIARRNGVRFHGRTLNQHSMPRNRDFTALPKSMDVKPKTINELDTYLGWKKEDLGVSGYLESGPTLDLEDVPAHLHADVLERYGKRLEEFTELQKPGGFRDLIDDGVMRIEDGKVIHVANGKPFGADFDLVGVSDAETGKWLDPASPRYDQAIGEAREAGLIQHGSEQGIVHDFTDGLRPGSPEFAAKRAEGLALQAKLQETHAPQDGPSLFVDAKKQVVVSIDGAGNVRRGQRGFSLTPPAEEVLVEAAESVPPPGSVVPAPSDVVPAPSGLDPSPGVGGAVGSTIGRELEGTPDA